MLTLTHDDVIVVHTSSNLEVLLVALADSGTAVALSGTTVTTCGPLWQSVGGEWHSFDASLNSLSNRAGPDFSAWFVVTMGQQS